MKTIQGFTFMICVLLLHVSITYAQNWSLTGNIGTDRSINFPGTNKLNSKSTGSVTINAGELAPSTY
jgi:hypothetical protein